MEETLEAQKASLDRFLADNPELEELSARVATFNLFRALRIEDAEIRHSNVLAWLLDPLESHGLDDIVLRRLLSNMILESDGIKDVSAAQIELMEFTDIEVRREWRHIDILVIDRKNEMAVLIENKIWSGEGKEQLTRYLDLLKREFPSFRILPVFLTLEGRESEDPEAGEYISYSYERVLAVLERITKQRKAQIPESVSIFLDHYLDTLRRKTMQDEDLISLCKSIYRRHREAIDLIVEHGKTGIFGEVVEEVLRNDGDYEILSSRSYEVWFLPGAWKEMVPTNSTEWSHLKRRVSIVCWFENYPSNSNNITLHSEVSKMDDPQLRRLCVTELRKAGFKLTDKAFSEDARFSHFISFREKKIGDINDRDEVRAVVSKLLERAKTEFPKAEAVFRKVFKSS